MYLYNSFLFKYTYIHIYIFIHSIHLVRRVGRSPLIDTRLLALAHDDSVGSATPKHPSTAGSTDGESSTAGSVKRHHSKQQKRQGARKGAGKLETGFSLPENITSNQIEG